jgi:hypothetical protein
MKTKKQPLLIDMTAAYDVHQILDECPAIGEGVHFARHGAICELALLGYTPDEIREMIMEWGPPNEAKIEESLQKVFADGDPRLNRDGYTAKPKDKVVVDYQKVVQLFRQYGGYDSLLQFLKTTDELQATSQSDWLSQLFHRTDRLCLGAVPEDTDLHPLHVWLFMMKHNFLGAATKYCWMSPNPYKPDSTGRCNDGILERRYYVLEADITDFNKKTGKPTFWEPYLKAEAATGWDFQAAIIRHLFDLNYPIVSIVHSGGKSLHVWCKVCGTEEGVLGSIRYAASLGVDDKGKVPSQFMRIPNPVHPTRKQPIIYHNP